VHAFRFVGGVCRFHKQLISGRDLDFGGCRCQAFALTGDAAATDPVCHLAPDHSRVEELTALRTDTAYDYRCMRAGQEASMMA
jgi:hypothetical protein